MGINEKKIMRKMEGLYSVTGVPMALFSRDNSVLQLIPAPPEEGIKDYQARLLFGILENNQISMRIPYITMIDKTVLIGLLQLNEDLMVVFGPAAIHDADLYSHVEYMHEHYSASVAAYHMKLVTGTPRVDIPYFCNILLHAADCLLDVELSIQDIRISIGIDQDPFGRIEQELNRSNISTKQLTFDNGMYELIKNGSVEELEKKLKAVQLSSFYYFQEKGIYFLKLAFVFYSAIQCHYAKLGGLSAETIRSVLSGYFRKLRATDGPERYWELLPQLAMELCRKVQDLKNDGYESDIINTSIAYIRNNIYAPITLTELEEVTHATGKTITRHFKKYLLTTPAQYISDVKLEEAARLLARTDMRIVEIANVLNYSSQTHLNKNFLKKYNYTPMQYRCINR